VSTIRGDAFDDRYLFPPYVFHSRRDEKNFLQQIFSGTELTDAGIPTTSGKSSGEVIFIAAGGILANGVVAVLVLAFVPTDLLRMAALMTLLYLTFFHKYVDLIA